jgi:zinc transport system substrate-binding protein
MFMKTHAFIALVIATGLISSCKKSTPPAANAPSEKSQAALPKSGKPRVLVDNYPLHYFTTRIAGDAIECVFPAPPDEDPAFWQPSDTVIGWFQDADLILMNGATYSKWVEKASLPSAKLVDTSAGFKASYIEVKDAVTHSHGPEGDHSHGGIAFTTWIDFSQAAAQATAIRTALGRVLPDAATTLDANLKKLTDELAALDAKMKAVGSKMNNAPVVASHPVYQYLARRYAINLKAVLWEPETVPDDKAMEELKGILATHPAKWMIWEGEPAKESVEKLKALGIESIVFDPSGNTPESGDFMSVMQANIIALEKALP